MQYWNYFVNQMNQNKKTVFHRASHNILICVLLQFIMVHFLWRNAMIQFSPQSNEGECMIHIYDELLCSNAVVRDDVFTSNGDGTCFNEIYRPYIFKQCACATNLVFNREDIKSKIGYFSVDLQFNSEIKRNIFLV